MDCEVQRVEPQPGEKLHLQVVGNRRRPIDQIVECFPAGGLRPDLPLPIGLAADPVAEEERCEPFGGVEVERLSGVRAATAGHRHRLPPAEVLVNHIRQDQPDQERRPVAILRCRTHDLVEEGHGAAEQTAGFMVGCPCRIGAESRDVPPIEVARGYDEEVWVGDPPRHQRIEEPHRLGLSALRVHLGKHAPAREDRLVGLGPRIPAGAGQEEGGLVLGPLESALLGEEGDAPGGRAVALGIRREPGQEVDAGEERLIRLGALALGKEELPHLGHQRLDGLLLRLLFLDDRPQELGDGVSDRALARP